METVIEKSAISGLVQLPAEMTIPRDSERFILVDAASESKIILEQGSKLTFVLFGIAGWEGLRKITFEFAGKNSELTFLGFIVGTGEQKYAFETISHHVSPETKAHYYVRAAMFDHSMVDYKGNLNITKPAQLTDTYLAHHTLLLSDYARARTVPALEIEADDVKAGHAATIGKVDDELLFYLQSRGIDTKLAEQMLISGFFETYLAMVPDEQIRATLRDAIMNALPLSQIHSIS